eukprot:TRINITY_DN32693_c0_g1_i2.p1 TRINITY_DN32693_c0_g1~~TRINITY_DN32693_c0_g1_i2.p1  ORF type:complete len:149 (+),score=9.96 TRINITY_DN32693_c0_g1_i2:172-618(+)
MLSALRPLRCISAGSVRRASKKPANAPSGSAKCDPHGLGGVPLEPSVCATILQTHHPKWTMEAEGSKISRAIELEDYESAMRVVQLVGHVVQNGVHYPDVRVEKLDWRNAITRVTVETWSPRLGGLSFDDFALAMDIDENIARSFPGL